MSPRRRLSIETAALLLLTVLGVVTLLLSLRMGLRGEDTPGPGLFPAAASAVMLALLIPIALGLRLPRTQATSGEEEVGEADAGGWRRLGLYLLAMGFAALALMPLGFALGVGLALLLVLRLAERLSWLRAALVTVCGVTACFLLFDRLLEVPLPRGVFWPG